MEETDDMTAAYTDFGLGGAAPLTDEEQDGDASHELKMEILSLKRELSDRIVKERASLLKNEQLGNREKRKLLEENRRMFIAAMGGRSSDTENVAYSILIFAAIVTITLALLAVFADLPTSVVLAFIGTTLGGTIATIAQKLGNV